jgi:hypothetical protein
MPPSNAHSQRSFQEIISNVKPSIAFIVIIFGALIAFEVFNFSTTEHALTDLLGGITFLGISWATILALAFCGIDFAGIARLFTPEQGMDEPKEVWYLFGAWLLAATMNAILTWWGVSMAIANHPVESSSVVDPKTIVSIVPIFVAIMVWVIRILIIGTLSLTVDRLMHPGVEQRTALQNAIAASKQPAVIAQQPRQTGLPAKPVNIPASLNSAGIPSRTPVTRSMSASKPAAPTIGEDDGYADNTSRGRADPTYHSLSLTASPQVVNGTPGANSKENASANRYRR